MPTKINKLAATAAVAAVLSMLATPAAAVELPRPATVDVHDGDALNAERDRRRRWRDRDNDVDTGDVVAGVVILGAIAAIVGAGKNRRDRERERYEPYPQQNDDYGYQAPGGYERADGRGIDRAVDMCVGEVERGADRVGSVDNASRSGEGWHVSGALENGEAYSCTIGNDGRIGDVTVGERSAAYAPAEDGGQWSDADYAKARADQGYAEPGTDEGYGDDRYETAQAPDFAQ